MDGKELRERLIKDGPDCVLIDDYEKNIREWEKQGGTGILYRSAEQTLQDLGKMFSEGEEEITVNGNQYYLTESKDSNGGKMLANTTTPDGHVVDETGKRIK